MEAEPDVVNRNQGADMGSGYGERIRGGDTGSAYGEHIRGADTGSGYGGRIRGLPASSRSPRHTGSRRSVRAVMDAQPCDVRISSSGLQGRAVASALGSALGTQLCLTVLCGLSFPS